MKPSGSNGGRSTKLLERGTSVVSLEELTALYDASALLSRSLEIETTQDAIVLAARKYLGFDRAGLWLYSPEKGYIQGAAGTDEQLNPRREDNLKLSLDDIPATTRAVISGEIPYFFTDDLEREEPNLPNPAMRGVRHNAVVPIRIGDGIAGFLSVDNLVSERAINESQVRLLLLYANYAAAALQNAQTAERTREHRAEIELRKQLERKLQRLQQVHEVAAAITSLDLDAVLRLLRNRLVEVFGYDRAGILLLETLDARYLTGTWGTDEKGRLLDERQQSFYFDDHPEIETVIRGEQPFLLRHWSRAFPPSDPSVPQHVLIPLRSSRRMLGVLSVDNGLTGRPITEADVEILLLLAEHASLAIQKAHLYALEQDVNTRLRRVLNRETRIASTLQKAFKPVVGNSLNGAGIAHLYRPAIVDSDLGGDFYDILDLGSRGIGIVMADVSGKGLVAAARAARARFALQAYASEDADPLSVISRLNRFLYIPPTPATSAADLEAFLTLFYGVFNADTGELRCATAGHEPPLWVSREGTLEFIALDGLPLGIFSEYSNRLTVFHLERGDRLLLYSDGVTEARRNQEFFGFEGLLQAVEAERHRPLDSLVRRIYQRILRYSEGPMRDDVALLMIERE